ncbi:MAG: hydroxyacylglutathione hydrolase [Tatlockia sp.]|nr:hydroxyacylglutathione hydrolase [Tatlockia sp.]
MKIQPLSAFYDNYIWMIINEENKQVLCIDPGQAEPVIRFLDKEKLSLQAILLTHHHNDHMGGVSELINLNPKLPVYGPYDKRIPEVDHSLKEPDYLKIDSYQFKIINTPGHTASHISYYEPNQGWLFCGDTLFSAGCGRVFDGTIEELHDSLQKLKNLPENTQVFAAHEYTLKNLRFAATVEPDNLTIYNYAQLLLAKSNTCSLPSSIAVEKEINPFFRTETAGVKAFAKLKGSKSTDSLAVFKLIRAEKDNFN